MLLAEACHAIPNQIAAHHALGKPALIDLVDHAIARCKVWFTLRHERSEGHRRLETAALGMPDLHTRLRRTDGGGSGSGPICKLDLPDAVVKPEPESGYDPNVLRKAARLCPVRAIQVIESQDQHTNEEHAK